MSEEEDSSPPATVAIEATRIVMDRVSLLEDPRETHINFIRDKMEKQTKSVPRPSKLSETSK